MVLAAFHNKEEVLLLLIHCLLLVVGGGCVLSLFCYAVLNVLCSVAVILLRKKELVYFLYFVLLMSCDLVFYGSSAWHHGFV